MKAIIFLFVSFLLFSCSRIAVQVTDNVTSKPIAGAGVTRNFFTIHKTDKHGIAFVHGYLRKRYVHVGKSGYQVVMLEELPDLRRKDTLKIRLMPLNADTLKK